MVKIDLHVHSRYSDQPSLFLLQRIGCPESFTEASMARNASLC